jgi:cytochrome c oxidase subunit IV
MRKTWGLLVSVSDFSYIVPYFAVEEEFFRDHPYRLQVVASNVGRI